MDEMKHRTIQDYVKYHNKHTCFQNVDNFIQGLLF